MSPQPSGYLWRQDSAHWLLWKLTISSTPTTPNPSIFSAHLLSHCKSPSTHRPFPIPAYPVPHSTWNCEHPQYLLLTSSTEGPTIWKQWPGHQSSFFIFKTFHSGQCTFLLFKTIQKSQPPLSWTMHSHLLRSLPHDLESAPAISLSHPTKLLTNANTSFHFFPCFTKLKFKLYMLARGREWRA